MTQVKAELSPEEDQIEMIDVSIKEGRDLNNGKCWIISLLDFVKY